jgi:anaerobic ribonucleoside-triphosphate reductase activating protein
MVHEYNDPGCRLRSVLNLACFLARSEVNGPGIRAVVWVQGCPHRCEGCFNPQFLSFSPARQVTVNELTETILSLPGLDGVTFSGGEPFAQAVPLAALGARVRKAGLDIVTYSGYPYEQLATGTNKGWQDLLSVTDLLIAGPYIPSLQCTGSLRGSSNQQLVPLSGRISGELQPWENREEFTISTDGEITATGFPDMARLRLLAARCRGI